VTEIDPRLSRIYREASTEGPPAALDAAILAAARMHPARPQRRERSQRQGRSLWSRWLAPASALATLVVAVSLAFLVEREQPETPDGTAIREIPPRPQSPPPASATESAKAKAAGSEAPAAAGKKEAPAAAVPTLAPAAPAPAPVAPTQAPVPRPAAPAPSAAEAFPAESRAKAAAPKAATESNVASDSALGGAGAAAPAAPAAARKLAPLRQPAIQRSPEAWLDEISRLKREGRDKEAAEQLAEFRKTYPAYAVPENFLK